MTAPAPPRRWPPAALAFVLGCLLTAAAAGGLYYAVALRNPAPAGGGPAGPEFPRPEFTRLVLNKAEAEVVAAVGPPDSTSEDGDTRYWHFKRRTRDPLTGDLDSDVQVVVQGGRAVAVNY